MLPGHGKRQPRKTRRAPKGAWLEPTRIYTRVKEGKIRTTWQGHNLVQKCHGSCRDNVIMGKKERNSWKKIIECDREELMWMTMVDGDGPWWRRSRYRAGGESVGPACFHGLIRLMDLFLFFFFFFQPKAIASLLLPESYYCLFFPWIEWIIKRERVLNITNKESFLRSFSIPFESGCFIYMQSGSFIHL